MARAAKYDRDSALAAAMSLFWRKGYHATSLKDLESALGMKPGSIYAAFANKENLYLLALERYFERSRDGFRALIAEADSPLDALATHILAYADLPDEDAARQACMLTKTLVETRATDPDIVSATRRYLDEMGTEFAKAFAAARDRGEIPPDADPDRLARRYQANLTALRIELHRGAAERAIRELAEDLATELDRLRTA